MKTCTCTAPRNKFLFLCPVLLVLMLTAACQNNPRSGKTAGETTAAASEPGKKVMAILEGGLPHTEYDSVFNRLTIYENESFDLRQVDRIAEHHLNERDHRGVFALLGSDQVGLYDLYGNLMLRFIIDGDRWQLAHLESGEPVNDSMFWHLREGHFPPAE